MGKRTGRKRGAPQGNTNRLTHGRYCAAAIAQRREAHARTHEARLVAAWIGVVERLDAMERAGLPVPKGLMIGRRGGGTPSET